jgi:hypothetical protein
MAVTTAKDEPEDGVPQGMLTPPEEGTVPYGGKGLTLNATGDVHPYQLIEEIYQRLGERGDYEVVVTESHDGKQRSVHVLGDADRAVVQGVIDSHDPDPDYGLSAEERRIQDLKHQLKSGADLSPQDLNTLMRAML